MVRMLPIQRLTDEPSNERVKSTNTQKCVNDVSSGRCGLVRMFFMKVHVMLKALPSLQAQRWHLRVYVKIGK